MKLTKFTEKSYWFPAIIGINGFRYFDTGNPAFLFYFYFIFLFLPFSDSFIYTNYKRERKMK